MVEQQIAHDLNLTDAITGSLADIGQKQIWLLLSAVMATCSVLHGYLPVMI